MRFKSLLVAVLAAYALPCFARWTGKDYLARYLLLAEDGLFEAIGALACLAAALLFGGMFLLIRAGETGAMGRRNLWHLAFSLALGLMFFEEISWGERLLGFAAPRWVVENNQVGEFNLHNLRLFYDTTSATNYPQVAWMLAVTIYLGVLPFAARRWPGLGDRWPLRGLPIPSLAVGGAFLGNGAGFVAYLAWTLGPDPASAGQLATELFEFVAQMLLLVVAVDTVVDAAARSALGKGAFRGLLSGLTVALSLVGAGMGRLVTTTHVPMTRSVHAIERGNALLAEGKDAEALEEFGRAARIWPASALAHYSVGLAAARLGREAVALAAYARAIEVVPTFAEAHINRGMILLGQDRVREAANHFEKGVKANPTSADAHNNLGVALGRLGESEQARASFRAALALDANHGPARANLERMTTPPGAGEVR